MTQGIVPQVTEQLVAQQLQRACDELSRRLRANEPARAEDLLATCPLVQTCIDAALELLYTEFVVREELGECPSPDEWYRRFPHWRSELDQLFQVHRDVCQGRCEPVETWPERRTRETCSTAAARVTISRRLDGHDLLAEIGRGGMGVVYQARQRGLDRVVALKVVRCADEATPEELARFRAEAQAAARLQHPNIVQVFDVGVHDGSPYLSMEFVGGGSVEDKLGNTPLPATAAAQLVERVAQAVHYAHERGIVHRDLKPANILLMPSDRPEAIDLSGHPRAARNWEPDRRTAPLGSTPMEPGLSSPSRYEPKISDFGLAKLLSRDSPPQDTVGPSPATRTGALLGTPSYMAPEQANGKSREIGPRTDVYALGATLYRLLTGRPPFLGETALDTMDQVRQQEPVPPSRLCLGLPRDLETICLKCLQKAPAGRYETAAALAEDLHRFIAGEPILARRIGIVGRAWRSCRRRPLVAALLVLLILVSLTGVTGVCWQWRRAEQQLRLTQRQKESIAREQAEARQQRDRARANLMEARAAFEKVTGLGTLYGSSPEIGQIQLPLLRDALAFYEVCLKQEGQDPGIRFERAWVFGRIGHLLREMGESKESEEHFLKGIEILERLVRENPHHSRYREYLAGYHAEIGHVIRNLPNRAVNDAYNRAVEQWEVVHRDPRRSPNADMCFANTLRNQAYVLATSGHESDAVPLFFRALTLQYPPLRAAFVGRPAPATEHRLPPVWGQGLTTTTSEAVHLADGEDPLAEIMRVVSEAEAAPQPLASDVRDCLSEIAWTVKDLSDAHQRLGQLADAVNSCRQAVRIRKLLLAQEPNSPSPASNLARDYMLLATLLSNTESRDERESCYRQMINLMERHVASFPDNAEFRLLLATGYLELSKLVTARNIDEAEPLYFSAIDCLYRMPRSVPWDSTLTYDQFIEIQGHVGFANILASLRKFDTATTHFERAIELVEKHLHDHANDTEGCKVLAYASEGWAWASLHQGNIEAYRSRCAWIVMHFDRFSNLPPANDLIWTCLLAPVAVTEMDAVVQLAERSVAAAESSDQRQKAFTTYGAALCRAGRFEAAVGALEQAGDTKDLFALARNGIFLSIAHARLGHTREARQWLDKTARWIESQPLKARLIQDWNKSLEIPLLMNEAQTLLNGRESSVESCESTLESCSCAHCT